MPIESREEVSKRYYGGDYKALFDLIKEKHIKVHGTVPNDDYYHEINILINTKVFGVRNFGHDRKKNCTTDELNGHRNISSYLIECISQHNRDPKELIIEILDVY